MGSIATESVRRVRACLLFLFMMVSPFNVYAKWDTYYYEGLPFQGTGDPRDLDQEFSVRGANVRILKYSDGSYVQAIHPQWSNTCGLSCLATVIRKMGFARTAEPLFLPAYIDMPIDAPGPNVDLRFAGSEEHLAYLTLKLMRGHPRYRDWGSHDALFVSHDGRLNNSWPDTWLRVWQPGGPSLAQLVNYELYPNWGVGCQDAWEWPLNSDNPAEILQFRRTVQGFIDHDIPVVMGTNGGAHFNVLFGYRGKAEDLNSSFYIYAAETGPNSWKRIEVNDSNVRGSGLICRIMLWNRHLAGGCEPGGWAYELDRKNGNNRLCRVDLLPESPWCLPPGVENVTSLNLNSGEGRLSVTADSLLGVFASDRSGQCQLLGTHRASVAEDWEAPEIIKELESPSGTYEPALQAAGLALVFASTRPGGVGGPDVWMATRANRNDKWLPVIPLNEINSQWDDGGPCLSSDGLTLYFHSQRPGGLGSTDIYYATRSSAGQPFGQARNLSRVNSSSQETTPWISNDGLTLYFASDRQGGKGDFDIWYVTRPRVDAPWSEPENLSGANSAFYEFSPCFDRGTQTLYFESVRLMGLGSGDIFSYRQK